MKTHIWKLAALLALIVGVNNIWGAILFSHVPPRIDSSAAGFSNLGDGISPQQLAGDFAVSSMASITSASWWGIYRRPDVPTNLTEIEFTVRFFADAGNRPGALLQESSAQVLFAPHAVLFDGTVLQKFSGALTPPMLVTNGVRYWISILDSDSATVGFRWSESDLFEEIARASRVGETGPWQITENAWPMAYILEGTRLGGTAVGWGGEYGEGSVVPGFTNVVAIAAGPGGSLGVKADGTIVAAGEQEITSRQPTDLTNVIAVAVGFYFASALRADGTVVGWGVAQYGETDVPPDLTNVVALSAGNLHSLALKKDGRVTSWGWNGYGQTGVPANLSNVVAVAAGGYHSLALRTDGSVIAWGSNDRGQSTAPSGLGRVQAIAAGWSHSLALLEDGRIVAWGDNSQGQLNVPHGISDVAFITAGGGQNLVLRSDGTVIAWGDNRSGQAIVPAGLGNVSAVAGGFRHSIALVLDNPSPTALDQTVTGNEDAAILVALTATDDEAESLTATIERLPNAGVLYHYSTAGLGHAIRSVPTTVSDAEMRVVYVPAENGNGSPFDSFEFTVNDGESASTPATVIINVRPVNDAPVAVAELSSASLLSSNENEYVVLARDDRATLVTLDGSLSSDLESDPLQYVWSEARGIRPIGTTAMATIRVRPGIYMIRLAVSDGSAFGFDTIHLKVVTRAQAISELIRIVAESDLRASEKRSLIRMLTAAASFNRNGDRARINQLKAFKNKVRGQIARKNPALAERLIGYTDALIRALEGAGVTAIVPKREGEHRRPRFGMRQ